MSKSMKQVAGSYRELSSDLSDDLDLGVADGVIADLQDRLTGLTADTPEGYEQVKAGLKEVASVRIGVDKSRMELKRPHLDFGKKVDEEAKRITAQLIQIEQPLKQEKQKVDDVLKAEKKAREKAEQDRKNAEQIASRKEIDEARRQIAADQEALDAGNRKLDADRIAVKEAADRKEREELDAKKNEDDRIASEALAKAMQPDKDQIDGWALGLMFFAKRSYEDMELTTEGGRSYADGLMQKISSLVVAATSDQGIRNATNQN